VIRSSLILLLVAPLAFAAPVPKEMKSNDERIILGTWEVTAFSSDGAEIARGKNTLRWRFEAEGRAATANPTETAAVYKVHPKLAAKGFDWGTEDYPYRGLYELTGDTLKIAISCDDDLTRPLRLAPGPNLRYYEFKRVVPDAK
jgi:uncharacterized protein (TIGR03067 family)